MKALFSKITFPTRSLNDYISMVQNLDSNWQVWWHSVLPRTKSIKIQLFVFLPLNKTIKIQQFLRFNKEIKIQLAGRDHQPEDHRQCQRWQVLKIIKQTNKSQQKNNNDQPNKQQNKERGHQQKDDRQCQHPLKTNKQSSVKKHKQGRPRV